MDYQTFDKLADKMYEEEKAIAKSKGIEYTQGDRLDNFKRLGKELGISPKKVLWVYLKKHLDSIASYIKTEKVYSESIEGRIMDARVYLSLLRGLIEETTADEQLSLGSHFGSGPEVKANGYQIVNKPKR